MTKNKIKDLVSRLTLEEKAGLTSGLNNWLTKPVDRLGIPSVRTSDGPHGLRLQESEVNKKLEEITAPAVCFPPACTLACSFDRELIKRMGEEIGKECQAYGVDVILGPGVNMKRSSLCGRNFEYFSEDPLVAGELGSAYVSGVQSQGVATSLKHFFANNQEYRRMDWSSDLDERTMREIYLPAFETIVKKASPATIMASYNKINGIHSTANKQGLTDILREEWGYDNLVISDWGATHDRVAAIKAGCDITMPAEKTDDNIVKAVLNGELLEEELNACVERILQFVFELVENRKGGNFDFEGGHKLAEEVAAGSIVLLKNEEKQLPLNKKAKIAFIGEFAKSPRYQGGGSSHVNSKSVKSAFDAITSLGLSVMYAQGYETDARKASNNPELLTEAIEVAKNADVTVIFAGLPENMETEGVDRSHMRMPEYQNELIRSVCNAVPNTVVIMHHGAPVEMPWVDAPKAILDTYLGGESIGKAVVDVLFGDVNPSGHLAETLPVKLSDNPSYLFYGGENGHVSYSEGIYIGYRYYETKELKPLFPFGHGLSYTDFKYGNLKLSKSEVNSSEGLNVSVDVTNIGKYTGKDVVQLYIAPPKGTIKRPVRELRGFEKIELLSGETKTVIFELNAREFSHWNIVTHSWLIEEGEYTVQIGENAHDIILSEIVKVNAPKLPSGLKYSDLTTIGDFYAHPLGKEFVEANLGYMLFGMVNIGMIPAALIQAIGIKEGDRVNLELINTIAENAGTAQGESGGIAVFLALSINMLVGFVPEETKEKFATLLDEMNWTGSF